MSRNDFTYTGDQVIKAALRKLRAIDQEHGEVEPYQITNGREALNRVIKSLSVLGVNLWAQQDIHVRLVKGRCSYTLGPGANIDMVKPERLYAPLLRQIKDGTETPILMYNRDDYRELPSKKTQGTPVGVYYDRQLEHGELFVWPTPGSSKQLINITAQMPLEEFDDSGDEAYVQPYAYDMLVWSLAAELASEYGISLQEITYLEQKAHTKVSSVLSFEDDVGFMQLVPYGRD